MTCTAHNLPFMYAHSKTEELLCEVCAKSQETSSISLYTIALCQSNEAMCIERNIGSILNEIERASTAQPREVIEQLNQTISDLITNKISPKLTEFYVNIAKLYERLKIMSSVITNERKEIQGKMDQLCYIPIINKKNLLENMQKEVGLLTELQMSYYKDVLELMNKQFYSSLEDSIKEAIYNGLSIDFTIKSIDATILSSNSKINIPPIVPVEEFKNQKRVEPPKNNGMTTPEKNKKIKCEEKESITSLITSSREISDIKTKILSISTGDCLVIENINFSLHERALQNLLSIFEWNPYSELHIKNILCNLDTLGQMIKSMKKSVTLKRVMFIGNCKPKAEQLKVLLKDSNISTLSLSECEIKHEEIKDNLQLIGENYPNLRCFEMKCCNISDSSADDIRDALIKNTHLIRINLSNNKITQKGLQRILMALTTNKSLETIIIKGGNLSGPDKNKPTDAVMKRKRNLEIIT